MTDATAIISNTGTAFRHLPAAAQAAQIEETARRLVAQDVRYCVSSLVAALFANDVQPHGVHDLPTAEDLYAIAYREPDAGDYREAARDAGILSRCTVRVEDDGKAHWYYDDGSAARDEWEEGEEGRVVDAWRALLEAAGADQPEGTECLEHWLVSDWLADQLEAQGEAVARDVAGLTIWGRCTSGQLILADGVFQRIARDILEA